MTEIVSRYTFLVAILNAFVLKKCENCYAQLFLMDVEWGGGAFCPYFVPSSFTPVISTNIEIGPQNILTFNFYPFATHA